MYLEYGFDQVISQEYNHGEDLIVVDIFEMSDSDAAYGIYSCNRNYAYPRLDIGDDGFVSDYQVNFWQDRFYVVIMGYKSDEASKQELVTFSKMVSKKIAVHAQPPLIITWLPSEGQIPRSNCYIRGYLGLNNHFYFSDDDLLEFERNSPAAVCAKYALENDLGEILLIAYHNFEQAMQVAQNIQSFFEKKFATVKDGNIMLSQDDRGRFYGIILRDNKLYVLLKTSSQKFCEKVIEHLN